MSSPDIKIETAGALPGGVPASETQSVNSTTIGDLATQSVPATVAKKRKPRTKSTSALAEDKHLISTSSPEGIAAASQITPSRIARILLTEGPLPIRHLTSQLVAEVPAFGHLSLSKQRRLIMAALEVGNPETYCVFDKIGWGQWEAHVVTPEEFKARAATAASSSTNAAANSTGRDSPNTGTGFFKPTTTQQQQRRRSSGRRQSSPGNHRSSSSPNGGIRRESITNPASDLHNTKVPTSPSLLPLQNLRQSYRAQDFSLDDAIESSSEDEVDDLASGSGSSLNEDLSFEELQAKQILRTRSQSSSNSRRPSFGGVAKPRKPRTSFTSHSIEAALDDGPRIPFSSTSNVSRQSFLRTSISPRSNPVMMHDQLSNLSIASSSGSVTTKPRKSSGLAGSHDQTGPDNFTDEEDWEAIGPSSLRSGNHQLKDEDARKDSELAAATALMDLHTPN